MRLWRRLESLYELWLQELLRWRGTLKELGLALLETNKLEWLRRTLLFNHLHGLLRRSRSKTVLADKLDLLWASLAS